MSECVESYESDEVCTIIKKTDLYLTLMDRMTSELSQSDWFGVQQLEKVAKAFDQYVDFTNPEIYMQYREKEKDFFNALLDRLPADDLLPYYDVIHKITEHPFKNATSVFFNRAQGVLLERLSLQIIGRFCQRNFIQDLKDRRPGCFQTKLLLFDPTSLVWTKFRDTAFNELKKAEQCRELRANAVDLFMWMDREQMMGGTFPGNLTQDMEIIKAWFAVLVTRQLEPRVIGSTRQALAFLDPDGTIFDYPEWWITGIKSIGLKNNDSVYPLIQRRLREEPCG